MYKSWKKNPSEMIFETILLIFQLIKQKWANRSYQT